MQGSTIAGARGRGGTEFSATTLKVGWRSVTINGGGDRKITQRFPNAFFEVIPMSRSVVIELEMPGDLKQFRLPRGVNRRLQDLLDKQSRDGKLTRAERHEAEGLVNLAEMLSLLRLRAERAAT